MASELVRGFISSMTITQEMWHDGTGYDLGLLEKMNPVERLQVERILIDHLPRDWRDVQALEKLSTAGGRLAIEKELGSNDPKVRREAQRLAGAKQAASDRQQLLVNLLKTAKAFEGLTEALDEVEEFHPPAVIDALFSGALRREGETAVHYAAMLFFLFGKSKEPFDWDHRPFFLQFNTEDPMQRRKVFAELCARVGVHADKYLK